MRTKIIAGNWKMHTSLPEAYTLAQGVLNNAEHMERITIVLCPPTIWLTELAHEVIAPRRLPHLKLGAQNLYPEKSGAFTGEVSPTMVREVAEYAIVGHSERTHLFHETPAFVTQKAEAALDVHLTPILCVGEDEQSDTSLETVERDLLGLIKSLPYPYIQRLVVAYEPVWAIGTGNAATPEYAGKVFAALREVVAPETRLLYGGSVNEVNARGYLELPECDGLLIGGTSLKLKAFLTICQLADDLAGEQGHRSLHE